MKVAVLSDVHALGDSFARAAADAESEGFDRLILLGDLLSYGVQVEQTLDTAARLCARHDAILIRGNHDQLYFDLREGKTEYLRGCPNWLLESVSWTCDALRGRDLAEEFNWRDEAVIDGIYWSHANPFGTGDWTYIRNATVAAQAAAALTKREFTGGAFGHVHRLRHYATEHLADVVTVGSVGQPRDADDPVPQWAMAEIGPKGLTISRRAIEFDRQRHLKSLGRSGLSTSTVEKLAGYFA